MVYCKKCGKAVEEGSSFCQNCGEKLFNLQSDVQSPAMSSMITDDDFRIFIQKNAFDYITKFKKFQTINSIDSFSATWHWPAFFVPFWWMLYRKIYGGAVLAFFIAFIPYVNILAMIVFGITGNYIYYKHAKKKLSEIKQLHPSSETQKAVIAVTGGVGNIAIIIGIILGVVAVMGILAAIAIPQFMTYRERGYNFAARSDVKSACQIADSIFAENPNKTLTLNDLEEKGFKVSPRIELKINNGSKEALNITARHTESRNKKLYIADKNCIITEEDMS